ncbi:MAG: aminotransferase class V-fold PLP-dependent enzyme, partial [Thermoanaerobaculia bacterium]
VTLTPRVRLALQREAWCHREEEFAALTLDLRKRLETVYAEAGRTHSAVLLGGSGTAAVEAMLSTFAPRDRPTLVATNGIYGERMVKMLEAQKKPFVEVRHEWTEALDAARVAAALGDDPTIAGVAVVHHETTTGRLNGLDELARLCRERGLDLLIDAVSSFGGEEIRFDDWRPLAVAATGGKCLHGAPGVSFVLAERERLGRRNGNATTLYLDLESYDREQKEGWSPFTQAVPLFFALQEALQELEATGGWRALRERYRFISRAVRATLSGVGVLALLPEGETSAILTAFRLPESDTYDRVHAALKEKGFVVYAGQGDLRKTIFRIANMGAIGDEDLDRLIRALGSVFEQSRD